MANVKGTKEGKESFSFCVEENKKSYTHTHTVFLLQDQYEISSSGSLSVRRKTPFRSTRNHLKIKTQTSFLSKEDWPSQESKDKPTVRSHGVQDSAGPAPSPLVSRRPLEVRSSFSDGTMEAPRGERLAKVTQQTTGSGG